MTIKWLPSAVLAGVGWSCVAFAQDGNRAEARVRAEQAVMKILNLAEDANAACDRIDVLKESLEGAGRALVGSTNENHPEEENIRRVLEGMPGGRELPAQVDREQNGGGR